MKSNLVKIYPNQDQIDFLCQNIGAARFIFNYSLALKKAAYEKFGKKVKTSAFTLIKRITKLKKREGLEWLKEPSIQVLQQAVLDMDRAYKNFFREKKGYPKFKKKGKSRESIRFVQNCKVEEKRLCLPKAGWLPIKGLRKEFLSDQFTLGQVTVFKQAGNFYASLLFKEKEKKEIEVLSFEEKKALGLDAGITSFLFGSDGLEQKPLCFKRETTKLQKRAQQLSRKKKGSSKREKAKKSLAKHYQKIFFKRKEHAHKLSRFYADNYDFVFVEDLNLKGMTRSAKGTLDNPGKNVQAKSGLNRAILQQSWSQFFLFLEMKLLEKGGVLVRVDPKKTSQSCSACGFTSKENRPSRKNFSCQSCGFEADADFNAAINIKNRGVLKLLEKLEVK